MPRDEELRKVAEDVRALARTLGRDIREAVDQARQSGRPTGEAVRDSLRGIADDARRNMRSASGRPYRHHRDRHHWGPPPRGNRIYFGAYPPYVPPGPAPAGAPAAPAGDGAAGDAPPPWAGPTWNRRARPPKPARSPLPPVRRRWDATTVAALLVILFGVAWLLGAIHTLTVPVEAVVAVGLMLLGASLIVTGRTDWSLSRRRWPVLLGILLIAVLVATSSTFGVAGTLRHVSFGAMQAAPTTSGRTVYGGFGNLTVDATGLGEGQSLTVESVAGQTVIETRAPVSVDARLAAGRICVDGRDRADGVNARYERPPAAGSAALVVHVHQMFGQVDIGSPAGCSR